ncbi:MAG TPA: hypothetical protein VI757_10510 [Bacteroidia bacterium]|nr:hypothetical protein [Bacteroidia bacterium]
MPVRAGNINAFDLKLLKALLNLKINRSHLADVSTEQKRDLCKRYNKDEGLINLSPDHLNRIWPKRKEILHSVTLSSLNQLCIILKKDYRWHLFTADVLQFHPGNIPNDKPYLNLSRIEKEKVDKAIEDVFDRYRTFEEFQIEVIDKNDNLVAKKKINIESNNDETLDIFASRVYIELSTRKAGIPIDENNDVIEEIYNSWYKLFCIVRDEMKLLPATYFKNKYSYPAIQMAQEILNEILRPHLTEHQSKFRRWFDNAKRNSKNKKLAPQELQKQYPNYANLIQSMREVNKKLIDTSEKFYDFTE